MNSSQTRRNKTAIYSHASKSEIPLAPLQATISTNAHQSLLLSEAGDTVVSSTNVHNRRHTRQRQEIRFFKQSALNVLAMLMMTLSFHVLSLLWTTPLGYFVLAQAPLTLYHGSNA